jgi:hypothetical protein
MNKREQWLNPAVSGEKPEVAIEVFSVPQSDVNLEPRSKRLHREWVLRAANNYRSARACGCG